MNHQNESFCTYLHRVFTARLLITAIVLTATVKKKKNSRYLTDSILLGSVLVGVQAHKRVVRSISEKEWRKVASPSQHVAYIILYNNFRFMQNTKCRFNIENVHKKVSNKIQLPLQLLEYFLFCLKASAKQIVIYFECTTSQGTIL